MKKFVKFFLSKLNIYHPIQLFYRTTLLKAKNIYYRIAYFKFNGKGFTCNYCNASYEKFVPEYPDNFISAAIYNNDVIAGYGENVYCPNCMSKNRERLLLAIFQNRFVLKEKSILHFSPEKHIYRYLRERTKIKTVDSMPGFYKNIDPNISYADATDLTFPDESFDLVIANHIMEHIPEDEKAMRELFRVTKKGGSAILQVPYSHKLEHTIEDPKIRDPKEQERLYGQRDHVRIYAFDDYKNRLTRAGFSLQVLTPDELTEYRRHAIQVNESVFLCHKI
jgi:SAM-dependent methyltransferase